MADPDYASLGRLLFGFKPEEPLEEPLKEPQDLIGALPLIEEQSPLDTGASLFKATEQTAPLTDASSPSALDTLIAEPKTADTVTGAIGSDTITGAAPDTGLADRFYDPMLKSNWEIENVGDLGLANDPRFQGQGSQVYMDPKTGRMLSRDEYLQVANTPEAVAYRNEQARIATANAELFRPGNTLTSGFGNITEQLGGSGYYKGVAIPTFNEIYDTEQGPGKSVAQQLADWKANIDKQDLSVSAPFGFVETPVYTQPTGDYDPYISGYQSTPATAFDYLTQNNPNIANAVLGHTSTGAFAYKVVNGELKEVGHDEITPEDIAQGNAFFLLAGATGGPNRQRMSQLYRADGNDLIPVGDPKMYQGAKEQDMGLTFLDMVASGLSFVPGPWQVPAMAYKAVRGAMSGDWAAAAKMFLPPVVATAVDVYEAFDSKDPFRIATTLMGTDILPEVGSFDLGSGITVKDAVLGAKLIEMLDKGQWDAAAIIAGQLSGSSELTAAGQGLRIKNAIERGDFSGAVTAAVGLSKTVNQLSKAPEDLINRVTSKVGVIDEYNVTGGGGALISSGNPTEDEQIALGQLNQAATSLVSDYVAAGGSMEPTDLRAALSKLTDPYGKPISSETVDRLVSSAESQLDTQTRNQKIQTDTLGVLADYTGRDSDLSRESAYERLVAAGNSGDRANEILAGVDAQVEANRAARAATQAQNQAAIAAGAGEFDGADARSAVAAGAGEFTGADAAAKANQRIQNQTTFANAFAVAREEFGPNATFNYGGKLYSTATAEERPDLTGKPADKTAPENQKSLDLTGATEWDLSLMRTPLGFDANNATTARLMSPQEFKSLMSDPKLGIDPSTLDQRYQAYLYSQSPRVNAGQRASLPIELAYRPPSDIYENPPTSFDEFKNTVLGGVVAGSSVASGAQNVINSLVTNLTAAVTGSVAGAVSSFTGDSANIISTNLRQLADITSSASDVAVPELANGARNIAQAVDNAQGFGNKVITLGKSVIENPGAALWWGAKETTEEIVPLAIAAKVLKLTNNAGAAAVADAFTNFVETQGLTQEELQKGFEKLGLTSEQAAQASTPGAFAQGAAEGLLSPIWEIPAIKALAGKMTNEVANLSQTLGSKLGSVTKAGAGETVKEGIEEGAGEAAKQFVMTGGLDTNSILTSAVIGGPLGGKASTNITALETLGGSQQAVSNAINNIQSIYGNDQASTLVNNLVGSSNLAAGGQTLASNLANVMGSDAAVTTANTLVGNLAISKVSDTLQSAGIDLENLSTVVGKTDSGNDITLGDALGASITGNGQSVSASTVVGLKPNGSDLTLGELASAIKTGNVSQVTTDFAETGKSLFGSGQDTATSGAVTTDVTGSTATTGTATDTTGVVTAETGATTGAATGATLGVDTATGASTSTDPATGVITSTSTDEATGVKTVKEVDPVTGESTVITSDETAGIVTKETIDSNESSTTTVDSNNNITTNTTVNTNTNTTTNITVNTNTGEVVVKVTNSGTGEVLDTQIKTVDELTPSELEKVTITDPTTKTPVTKTPVTKPPVATAPKPGSSAGFSIFGEIGRLGTPMLKSAGDTQIKNPLEQLFQSVDVMNQIDPALLAVMAQRLNIQPEQAPTFTYGQETSIDDILGLREPKKPEEALYAEGGYVEPLRAKPMNLQFMNRGGALPGGREDFKGGKHVAGDGDGQSDDIPAWLADGEFVFPADVVSALGNGSTKAGTDKLYKMMHEIRARARSTKVKDLPPPAHKSPLDYIKKGK